MKKQNCWEFKRCGRGPAAKNDCVVAQDGTLNGIHGGVNAGRACWVVAGTGGEAPASGTFAIVLKDCLRCDFFKMVQAGEQASESGFSATRLGMLKILQSNKTGQVAFTALETDRIDPHLRTEFVQEVNKVMSKKDDMARELIDEFAKEVELLSSRTDKKDR